MSHLPYRPRRETLNIMDTSGKWDDPHQTIGSATYQALDAEADKLLREMKPERPDYSSYVIFEEQNVPAGAYAGLILRWTPTVDTVDEADFDILIWESSRYSCGSACNGAVYQSHESAWIFVFDSLEQRAWFLQRLKEHIQISGYLTVTAAYQRLAVAA